jgi:hypothetical protein
MKILLAALALTAMGGHANAQVVRPAPTNDKDQAWSNMIDYAFKKSARHRLRPSSRVPFSRLCLSVHLIESLGHRSATVTSPGKPSNDLATDRRFEADKAAFRKAATAATRKPGHQPRIFRP